MLSANNVRYGTWLDSPPNIENIKICTTRKKNLFID